jgi:stearoyl-CoA desaturase (Delta-9 desaturase)
MHHSDPACVRHGVDPGQLDLSAVLIRVFERAGWATRVHWPSAGRLEKRRRPGERARHVQASRAPAAVQEAPRIASVL